MFVSAAAGGKARTLSFDLTSAKARLALCVALFVLLGQVVAFMLGAAASPQGSATGVSPATASISALAQGVGQAIALCEHVPSQDQAQDQADGTSAPGSHPHHSDCPFCPSAQAGALGALARVALVVPVRVPTHLDPAFEPRIWPTAHDLPAVHAPRGPPTLA